MRAMIWDFPTPGGPHSMTGVWASVSVLVLFACLYYPYQAAYRGFDFIFTAFAGRIVVSPPCPEGKDCLRPGDQLLAFGDVDWKTYPRHRLLPLDASADADGYVDMRVERNGEIREFRAKIFKYALARDQPRPELLDPGIGWKEVIVSHDLDIPVVRPEQVERSEPRQNHCDLRRRQCAATPEPERTPGRPA